MSQTGDVPPSDFNFEKMNDPKEMLSQDALDDTRPSNLNLYPRKRELEAQISAATEDLAKSKKLIKCVITSHSYFKKPTYYRTMKV